MNTGAARARESKVALSSAEANAELERLKTDVVRMFPYTLPGRMATFEKTLKLDLGIKIYRIQELVAHHGNGAFGRILGELKIPRSTAYELRNAAVEFLEKESLSRNRTKSETPDTDIDISNPEEVAELLHNAYKGKVPVRVKKPKPYLKSTQLHFYFDVDTRRKVAAAWKQLKAHPVELKSLSKTIAQEVIDAAANIKTPPKS